jgi:hypothetical protein
LSALAAPPQDRHGDLLKTLDKQKKTLTDAGVAAGAVNAIAQNLFDAKEAEAPRGT